ncbi:cupin domain-containing protein [Lapillicoccus jejuensis]|uniref:Cupin domain n=1 Tax=Lapillicoccus jejuensis TaxID=402171 RepID=A0A542DWU2_9MICO|nr:cupin domain-containing protein [Lapillicoccus jejuensis]TQJ07560.1 cupin domain [Lapillicoccus jejuensis]
MPTSSPDAARPCELVPADALRPADPTPGMSREMALSTGGMWSGTVDTEPGSVTGWHHHGEHETTLYIVSGTFRLESGPGGSHVVEARAGDFLHVPAGAVHRESNPADEPSRAVVVRCGSGVPTVNVEGPAPTAPVA